MTYTEGWPKRWKIYSKPDWDDTIFGPETGKNGIEVVPLSDAERLEEEVAYEQRRLRALSSGFQELQADAERLREELRRYDAAAADTLEEMGRLREALEYALGYIDDHPDNPRGKICAALDRDGEERRRGTESSNQGHRSITFDREGEG
jgi:hypothetical protein